MFNGLTGCEKSHLVLDLKEKKHSKHYFKIIITCPILRWNKTSYWRLNLIQWQSSAYRPKIRVYKWIETLSLEEYAGSETLFIIAYILAYKSFDKRRQSLLKLAVIPKNLKRYAKLIFVWYPNETRDLKMMQDEQNVLTNDKSAIVRSILKVSKHGCLYMRNEHRRGFKGLKTPKNVAKVAKDPKRLTKDVAKNQTILIWKGWKKIYYGIINFLPLLLLVALHLLRYLYLFFG